MEVMPKAENTFSPDESLWDRATQAQRLLLWEQGWRKVPSVEQILYRLAKGSGGGSLNDANELHRWLMEEE